MQYSVDQCLNFNTFFTLPKPQLLFPDFVENSDAPFVPHVKSGKMIKPILDASKSKSDMASYAFQNPYRDVIASTPVYPADVKSVPLRVLDTSCINLIDDEETLKKVVNEFAKEDVICIDVLNHSFRSYQGFVCLLMISTKEGDYVIDTLKLRGSVPTLSQLFLNKHLTKVFYRGSSMIEFLQRDFSLYIINGFDIEIATRDLHIESLEGLIEKYCQTIVPNKYVNADWRVRPLSKEMMYYSCSFTHYLPYIYSKIMNDGKCEPRSVSTESNSVIMRNYKKPLLNDDIEAFCMSCATYSQLSYNKQCLLRSLLKWRDTIARYEDESHQYVMPNTLLLGIVNASPLSLNELMYLCQNFVPPLVMYYANYIVQLVLHSKQCPSQNVVAVRKLEPENKVHVETKHFVEEIPKQEIVKKEVANENVDEVKLVKSASEATPFKDKTNSLVVKQPMQTPMCKSYDDIVKNAMSSSSQKIVTPSTTKAPEDLLSLFQTLGWSQCNCTSSSKKADQIYNQLINSPMSPALLKTLAQEASMESNDIFGLLDAPNRRDNDATDKIENIISKMQLKDDDDSNVQSPPDKLSMIYSLASKIKKKSKAKSKIVDQKAADINNIVNSICEIKCQKLPCLANKENQYSFFKKIGWYHESAKKGYQC